MKKNYFFLILFLLLAGIFHVQQAQAQNVARAYNSSGTQSRSTSARPTIQEAVNDAQSGDLIRILANVSTTSEVTINKSLTFRSGSNYGNSNTNRTVSNHTFIITDPSVTLTMRDRTGASGRIILDNSTITTNIPDYYVVSANATGSNSNTNYTVRNEVARVGNTYYATVQAAVDAATNGDIVIIQRSDSLADVENVTINKTLTFTTRDDGDFALSNYNIIISAAGATVTTNNHIDISSSTVTTNLTGYYVVSATSGDNTVYTISNKVARIGETDFTSLDAAIDAVHAGETIEILADSVGITNTKVIPANVTITGQGKTATKMTIISSSGSGITINNPGVTLKKMTIDGSQITSGDYKTLVNVRADSVLIDSVIMTKGGMSTWNSSILVETLSSSQTFTVSNSTISGSFRGVLRESCSANIVITNCDITAIYPFNIDGGNGGTVTVTGGSLRGWTSCGGLDKVSFTDVEFSKGAGYAVLRPYVNTEINGSSFSSEFKVDPILAPSILFNNCDLAGTPLTSENIDNLLEDQATEQAVSQEDPRSHAVVVNGGYSTNDNDEITGGIYGGNPEVLSTMIASGYAAFPLNTDPQTYQVDPAYFIHFNAAGGTGTHGDSIVRRTSPTFTVPANTEFTYGSYGFLNWNSKPYGAGTDIAVGSTMTLSSDTTLYAEWNIDFVAKIGSTTYTTFQDAIDDATATMTGDVTIELMKNITEWVLIVQKAGLNLTIDGHGTTLTGQIIIDGEARHCGTETLAITNLNFAYADGAFATYSSSTTLTNGFVVTPTNKGPEDAPYKTSRGYIYSHNITVKDCNFDGNGSTMDLYAFKGAWGSNPRNIKLENCTAKNVFGFAFFAGVSHCDAVGTTGIEITNCEATENIQQSIYVSGGGSSTYNITGNTFTAEDFAVYIDNAVNSPTYNFSGNTLSADTVFKLKLNDNGAGAPITSNTNINITGGAYIGLIKDYDPTTHLNISGGAYSQDVSGEPCAEGYASFWYEDPGYWIVMPAYFLTYDANGGDGTMDDLYWPQDSCPRMVTVAANSYTLDGFAFAEWNTKADGTGTRVKPGTQITLTQDTVLYAQWARVWNVTQDKYYNTLQAAINDATAGDSLVVLTDMTIDNTSGNVSITIAKSLTINGNGYDVTCKDTRALAITTGNVNVTLRKLNIIAGYEGSGNDDNYARGFQVNSVDNVKLVMDSCRLTGAFGSDGKPIPYYAINMVGGANHKLNISNSYLWGRAALNVWATNSHITFVHDTLYGVNVEGDPQGRYEAFATIVLNDYCVLDSIRLVDNCVVIAERRDSYDQMWVLMQNGANNCDIVADESTKFIDINPYESYPNILLKTTPASISSTQGIRNSVRLHNLSADAIDLLRAYQHTVAGPDENGVYRVSHSIIYNHNYQLKHSDLDYPFVYGTLSNGGKLYLRENFTMTRNDTADINGQFELYFKYNSQYYDITQGDYSIVLREGSSCKTDKQVTSLFTSPDGDVIETRSGNAFSGYTYTYTVAPYIAYNVNRDIKYSVLQTAVDEVNNGDTVRILRNINLTSEVTITDKDFTLDLNGDTIRFENSTTGSAGSKKSAIHMISGNLVIKDRGENGAIITTGRGSAVLVGEDVYSEGNASVSLEKGKLTGVDYGLYVNVDDGDSVVINGGEVTATRSASFALYNQWGTVKIKGGKVGNMTTPQGKGIFVYGDVTIEDGTVEGLGAAIQNFESVTVDGGLIRGGDMDGNRCVYNGGVFTMNNGTVIIAGTLGFESTLYPDLSDLENNPVEDQVEPKLYIKGGVIQDEGNAVKTFGLSGGVLNITGGTITNSNATAQSSIVYAEDGKTNITISDGASLVGTSDNTYGIWSYDDAEVNITMTGGAISTSQYCLVNNGTQATSTSKWIITGGTLESSASAAIYHPAPDSVIIGNADGTGPAITGVNSAIEHRAGHLVVKGGTLTASADHYSCVSETSGTTTTGAAVAVSQHTTNRPTTVAINGGTLNGIAALSVANPETTYNDGSNVSATINGGTFNGMIVNDLALTINDGNFNLETISSGDVIFLHRSGAATIPATSTNIVNDGVFTVTAPNANSVKFDGTDMSTTVNNGWYSESLTAVTRGVKRNLAGDGNIAYAYNARLVPVNTASVTAAGLTGKYWQLGNFITYHSNDGRDSIIEVSKPIDSTITLLDGMAFAKLGHDMIYWNTEPDRTGVDYALGATSPSDNADLNLYAIWLLRECPVARDADGNVYATVRLGARYTCWMAENLRTTHYSDGRAVANPMALPAYMTPDYPDDDVRDSIFGLLYDWYDAVDTASNDVDSVAVVFNAGGRVHGICPQGWYVPNDRDFAELEPYGGFALRSESYWINQTGNNSTAFNAIPAGYYNCNTGRYENTFGYAVFQTCHPVYDMVSGSFIDYVCDNLIKKLELLPCSGFSVRCVLNDD